MATPPDPHIYMADDWSWAITGGTPATSWENYYVWDGHGLPFQCGYGTGASRGYGFGGEPSSGTIGWTIVDQDTLAGITSSTVGVCYGNNQSGVIQINVVLFVLSESAGGPVHVYFTTDASNRIRAHRGDGTVLGTTDGATGGTGMVEYFLPASAIDGSGPTYHIEAIVHVDNSVGTVQLWVNDIQVLDLTGKDTKNGGSGVIGYVEWRATNSRRICEVFVHDGTARLGSQWRVGYVPVGTAGTYTAHDSGTVADVNDSPASPETEIANYIVLNASGTPKKASFVSGALPASWLQVRDIFSQIVIEKSDGGANTGKTGFKSGATESYTTSAYGVPDAWVARRLAFRRDITAGNPLWTLSTAAATEVIIDRET